MSATLEHWTVFESDDHDHVAAWEHTVGLDMGRTRLTAPNGLYRFASVQVGEMTLWREVEPSLVYVDYSVSEGVVEFCMGTNRKGANWCGKELNDSIMVMHRGNTPYSAQIRPNAVHYGFVLAEDLLDDYLENNNALARLESSRTPLLNQLDAASTQLLHFADWIIDTAVGNAAVVEDWWIDYEAILTRLLGILERSTDPSKEEPPLPDSKWWRLVSDARDLIDSRLNEALTVSEIVREVHASRRSLETAFQSVIGISPYQYILMRKLHAVRHVLQQSKRSVLEVSAEYAFSNPARMAKMYKSIFGELPSETSSRS